MTPMRSPWALLCLWLLAGCGAPHDNPLDPENTSSRRPHLPLVELFGVDPAAAAPVGHAVEALEDLVGRVFNPESVIVLRYHLPSQLAPGDPLALDEAAAHYASYVEAPEARAVPDVFVDGPEIRVQGAADPMRARSRYRVAIEDAREADSQLTLEPTLLRGADGRFSIEVQVARLGVQFLDATVLHTAVVEDRGEGGRFVVRALPPQVANAPLASGHSRTLVTEVFDVEGTSFPLRPVAWLRREFGAAPRVLQTARGEALSP